MAHPSIDTPTPLLAYLKITVNAF